MLSHALRVGYVVSCVEGGVCCLMREGGVCCLMCCFVACQFCLCDSITDELLVSGALNQCTELVKLNLSRTNVTDKGR